MEDIIKKEGWTIHYRKRRKGTQYVYAAQRAGTKVKEVYLAPLRKAQRMSPEEFTSLLRKKIA
ncbi:MAG TPA: hypothetical protein VFA10_14490 [Ktedonobacteraceae bacterium]|nr:hypothetical protein [Ktedonobacteraceae bacterium]